MSEKPNVTPDQLQALLQYASKRLGTTPEKLAQTVQSGGLAGLSKLSPDLPAEEAEKIDAVVRDKSKAEALLETPEAQRLMQQILGKTKK